MATTTPLTTNASRTAGTRTSSRRRNGHRVIPMAAAVVNTPPGTETGSALAAE